MRSFSISRTLLIAAMLGLMALAALGFRAQQKDMAAFRQSSQESIHWSSAQVEVELSRFITVLGRYSMGDTEIDERTITRRYDILWSRTNLFRNGRVGARLREYDNEIGVIPQLVALLEQHENAIVNVERHERARHVEMIRDFSVVEDKLRTLSVRVLDGEERRFAAVRENMRVSGWLTMVVTAVSLFLSAILVGVMLIENKRFKRQAEESAALAERADAANRAKSRFLTMMSHELRTPMNGVLGLMALAKQSGLTDRQKRLIEQAERSGERMIGLLSDILDFSDLQMEEIELDKSAFEVTSLVAEIRTIADPVVQRMGVRFAAVRRPETPNMVVGDYARLRQAMVHFLVFIVETVGSKDLSLEFGYRDGALIAEMDLEVQDASNPGWQPEALFGREDSSETGFSSDSLGPAIARGMVSLMGGTVSVERRSNGRAQLLIAVPAAAVASEQHFVRIEGQSQTTDMLLRAMAVTAGWAIWDGKNGLGTVQAVLMEVGSLDEPPTVARLRSMHPGARLIALGVPKNPVLFDVVEDRAPTPELLNELIEGPSQAAEA